VFPPGRRYGTAAVLVATALLLSGCAREPPAPRLRLSQIEPVGRSQEAFRAPAGVLRLAVAPVYSPRRSFPVYRDLAGYLGSATGLIPDLVTGKTYAEINDLVRTGDVTLAVVCTLAYIEGQHDFGMEALVVPVTGGATVYYSYLIVPRDSPARRLEDLRGGTFAFSDPLSNSGRLAPVYRLLEIGETPESFFRRYIFTYSHDNSIQAVARKVVDGAAVDSQVYDYVAADDPAVGAATRIIARWGPYGINPVVVHPRLAPTLKQRLRQIFLTMHTDREGRQLLARLRVDRFIVPDDRLYDSVRTMRRRVKGQLERP
jgi:phosphonate transport system substrate-binding protein